MKQIKKILVGLGLMTVMIGFIAPVAMVQAQEVLPSQKLDPKEISPDQKPAETPCGATLCNPLKGVDSIGGLIFKIINFVYSLSYVVIALFLMVSGFKFVMAQGNETKLKDAKTTFTYTIIGAIILIGANVISTVIQNLINNFRY